jgi:hypothetical protein
MTIDAFRRIRPRLLISLLVDGSSRASRPRYIGVRIDLYWWAVEIYR